MTMLIAVNLGEYAVLAADKRTVMLGDYGLISYVVSQTIQKRSLIAKALVLQVWGLRRC